MNHFIVKPHSPKKNASPWKERRSFDSLNHSGTNQMNSVNFSLKSIEMNSILKSYTNRSDIAYQPVYDKPSKTGNIFPQVNAANPYGAGIQAQLEALPDRCKYCESEALKLSAGKSPHVASLVCEDCGKFQQWVSKAIVQRLGLTGGEANA